MPTIFIRKLDSHTSIGLWRIDKQLQMEDICPPSVRLWLNDKCAARQIETTAVYALLQEMTGRNDIVINHEPSGRPFLSIAEGEYVKQKNDLQPSLPNISLSHTTGYTCIMLSTEHNVSIDIEYRSDRVRRIASRFLREEELAEVNEYHPKETTTRLLLYWCSKETMFKYYSDTRLTFQNMLVEGMKRICEKGVFTCRNLIDNTTLKIWYEQNEELVMTYTIGK